MKRGWREERSVSGETTTGKPIEIVTGVTHDAQGRDVAALAIGDGPTLVLRLDGDVSNGTAITDLIRRALADLMNIEKRGGV